MKLKPSYDSEDKIPEGMKDYYVESGGKWVLQVEGISNIDSVQSAIRKERQSRQEAEKNLKEYQDKLTTLGKDPEDVLKDLDELEELRATSGNAKEDLEKAVQARLAREMNPLKRELEKLQKERDEATAKAENLSKTITNSKIEQKLMSVANETKVRAEAVEDLLRYKDIFDVTDDGSVVTKDGVGTTPGLDPSSWLSEMKEKRPHWWPDAVGGGAKGSGNGAGGGSTNPFDPKNFNLAEVMKIQRSDPAKAKSMASMAGYGSVDEAVRAAARASAQNA